MGRHCPDARQTEPAASLQPASHVSQGRAAPERHFGKQKGAWRGLGVSD